MDKLKMHSKDKTQENFEILQRLFPNAVTETITGYDEDGKAIVERAIDKDVLQQEINATVVDGREERYQFTWPDKKRAIISANAPISKTLRPCREESVDFDDTENLYIEGDNLEVLKLLQETYLGKIKMIYIDPPYNTGHDFVYNDKFSVSPDEWDEMSGELDEYGNRLTQNTESNGRFHTDWLNMIYPRLKLARDLLTDDGVIFISIDDNEVENLKKICEEIFGVDNYIGILSVENNPKGRKNSDFISVSSEYCVIFAKNKNLSHFVENIPKNASDMKLDEHGKYVHSSGKRVLVGENNFNKVVSNPKSDKNYSVYFRKDDYSIITKKEKYGETDNQLLEDGYEKYYSYNKNRLVENTYTIDKFMELVSLRALSFSNGKIYEKNYSDTIRMKSLLINREYDAIVHGEKKKFSMELTTTGAGTYLKLLFGFSEVPFQAPKNTGFLKMLLSLFDDKACYVLDFFSGSASFADAVIQLNAIDNGNRKYIMVQLPEKTDEKSEAYKAGYQNICEIGKERIRRAGSKIKAETGAEIDYGFRVLKLDSSNMKDVYYNPAEFSKNLLDTTIDNIKEDRTAEDLLFQVMLDLGVLLSSKIEETEIAGKKVFNVANGYLMACFDSDVNDETITAVAKQKPLYFVMRDSSLSTDTTATNFNQIFETYSPDTVRKVI